MAPALLKHLVLSNVQKAKKTAPSPTISGALLAGVGAAHGDRFYGATEAVSIDACHTATRSLRTRLRAC